MSGILLAPFYFRANTKLSSTSSFLLLQDFLRQSFLVLCSYFSHYGQSISLTDWQYENETRLHFFISKAILSIYQNSQSSQ